MPNSLDQTGLTVKTVTELVADLTASLQAIYGTDINVDPNSPDGQLINIFAQTVEDLLELLVQVYNGFSVPGAIGTILDQRVALNGLARRQGTYTTTQVLVTVSQAITLYGLDQTVNPPFTVKDNAGNQFSLAVTKTFAGAAAESLQFRAVDIGLVEVVANTITNQVTTVLGVTSVNNPNTAITTTGDISSGFPTVLNIPSTAGMVPGLSITGTGIPVGTTIISVDSATQVTMSANATATTPTLTINVFIVPTSSGVNEETDAQLKVRQVQSFALASTGPADAVTAALLAVPDITDAFLVENFTDNEVETVPAHTIWTIVTGGTDAEIAQAIYAKKGIGCGMKGSNSFSITRPNGTAFVAQWDASISQPLYIQFTINPRTPGQSFDTVLAATRLAAALVYKLGQSPTVGDIVNAMLTIEPNAYLTEIGVSDDGLSYTDVVAPETAQHYFTVSSANIDINT